jgi:hypothetical protein
MVIIAIFVVAMAMVVMMMTLVAMVMTLVVVVVILTRSTGESKNLQRKINKIKINIIKNKNNLIFSFVTLTTDENL